MEAKELEADEQNEMLKNCEKTVRKNESNLKPFKKGFDERRNLQGHPKGVENAKTRLSRLLSLVQTKENILTGEIEAFTIAELIDMAQINEALNGSTRAYKELMDRLEGQTRQSIDVITQELPPILPPISFEPLED